MVQWPVDADDVDVTDRTDLLGGDRAWKAVLAGGLAVLTAAAVTLVVRSGDPAAADTYLTSAREAVVHLADGSEHPAVAGERVPEGATVRTGPEGGAQLATGDRTVYVGRLSTVKVLDGVHQVLRRGWAMVDSRRGARLTLDTEAGAVETAAGALSRVEQDKVLRLAVYDGSATLTPVGRSLRTRVPGLYQVQVQYGSVAGRVTALALRRDDWDTRLAQDLVNADTDLNTLATGLAGPDGAALLGVAPVALRPAVAPPVGAARGELALGVAVAQAARKVGDPAEALGTVRSARAEGGSWGVVAAIVGARVTAVSALLDGALTPPGTGPGTGPAVVAGGPGLDGLFGPSGAPGSSGGPTSAPTSTRPTSRPTSTRTPTPSPSAGTVDSLVTTVVNLLPTPPPLLGRPAPTPTPTPTATPLLGIDLHLPPLLP